MKDLIKKEVVRTTSIVIAVGAAALMAVVVSAPAHAVDLQVAYVTPAELTPELAASRLQPNTTVLRPSFSAQQPALTNALLSAYVERQQELKSFNGFDVAPTTLNEQVLLGYIDRTRGTQSLALDAIDDVTSEPALNPAMLEVYAQKKFVPTTAKLKQARSEELCLTQAIYHEARGESEAGQWAVANVIINRAMSHKFPSTLCGVVFQNADEGFHHCQFTFACDGKSDFGTETRAWNRAVKMASTAYHEFAQGERPGVVPSSALYYHTTSVNPSWSNKFRPVAEIGAHIFYSVN